MGHVRYNDLQTLAKTIKNFSGNLFKSVEKPSIRCEPVLRRVLNAIDSATPSPYFIDRDRLLLLGMTLLDGAKLAYDTLMQRGVSWPQMTAELLRRYPNNVTMEGCRETMKPQSSSESFEHYYARYDELIEVVRRELPDYEKVFKENTATQGWALLPPPCLNAISYAKRLDMDELLDEYTSYKGMMARVNPTLLISQPPVDPDPKVLAVSPDTTCYACNQKGHVRAQCPQRGRGRGARHGYANPGKDQRPQGNTTGNQGRGGYAGRGRGSQGNRGGRTQFNQGGRPHQGGSNPPKDLSEVKCYKCGLPGHYASSCYTRCKDCGELGHPTKWCTQKSAGGGRAEANGSTSQAKN